MTLKPGNFMNEDRELEVKNGIYAAMQVVSDTLSTQDTLSEPLSQHEIVEIIYEELIRHKIITP